MPIVDIPTEEISDWDSFHDVFAEVLAFPDYYGRNMSAWIDCLTYADDEDAGMMSPIVGNGDVLTLQFDERGFAARCRINTTQSSNAPRSSIGGGSKPTSVQSWPCPSGISHPATDQAHEPSATHRKPTTLTVTNVG